jgi:hypothetical protein
VPKFGKGFAEGTVRVDEEVIIVPTSFRCPHVGQLPIGFEAPVRHANALDSTL